VQHRPTLWPPCHLRFAQLGCSQAGWRHATGALYLARNLPAVV
jgi:hypothetical protein